MLERTHEDFRSLRRILAYLVVLAGVIIDRGKTRK